VNILYTTTAYPPAIGGAQLHMHQLARQLRQRHSVQVVTQWTTRRTDWLLGTTLLQPAARGVHQLDGVPVHTLALSPVTRLRLAPWVFAYYAAQSAALGRIATAFAAELAPWAATADVVHNCRIGREGLSYASLKVARDRGVPFVLTPVHHPRWGGWLHRHYHRLYRLADAVIALTEAERETLIAMGVNADRVFVTGIGPILAEHGDAARFRSRFNLADEPLVLFLGQKYRYKGLGALLKAAPIVWRRFPEVRFAFVGPRTAYSRWLFYGWTDRRVVEVGEVDLREKTDAVAACDILCVPSSQESFGGVFTEAWSLGKPVVGCDIPAVRQVIDHGRDGLVVAQRPGPIADALICLLESPTLSADIGHRGKTKVDSQFTWPRLATKTEAVYRHVLGGGRA